MGVDTNVSMLCKVVPTRSARVLADEVPHGNPDSSALTGRDGLEDIAPSSTRCWPLYKGVGDSIMAAFVCRKQNYGLRGSQCNPAILNLPWVTRRGKGVQCLRSGDNEVAAPGN